MIKTLKFEKVVPEGKAMGYADGRACFVVGPLPGETARVRLDKIKPRFAEGVLLEITEASDRRQAPRESHYLSCSPWQGVEYDYQLELKRQMLAETMARPELALPVQAMIGAPDQFGYRNKLEFSLLADDQQHLSLAFHNRNSPTGLVALEQGCALGSEAMNEAARLLLERLERLRMAGYIQSLVLRQSQTSGDILAVITLHQTPKRDFYQLADLPFKGVVISRVYQHGRHEVVWQTGVTSLAEDIAGVTVRYPHDAFFQTNVGMFRRALDGILAAVPSGGRVVDLYGGSGAIGLPVAKQAREVVGVELHPAAVEQANDNAKRAGLSNYRALAVSAERLDAEVLQDADCVIVDPPRAGLHPRVIHSLIDAAPSRIIYLSCNPVTQARDLMLLQSHYRTDGVTGFDFYPGTLHLESLAILDRR